MYECQKDMEHKRDRLAGESEWGLQMQRVGRGLLSSCEGELYSKGA